MSAATTPGETLPAAPDYVGGSLSAVLPAVARSLGSSRYGAAPDLGLAPAARAVVVLLDGLGDVQLRRRSGHAPFLRGLLTGSSALDSGFPSTTATSMGSFGTGRPPGAHGLVGYEVLIPEEDRLLNELSWERGPVPELWQPEPTVFEGLQAEGIAVTRIGPGFFDGSGLTRAALRGGRFVTAYPMADRVTAAVDAVRATPRALAYLYWGELDKVGHVFGPDSLEWGAELESIDAALSDLARRVPSDTAIYVTADHGMVEAPFSTRVDLAAEPLLMKGVRHLGGEPRAVQLYCEPGAAADVAAAWRERLDGRAWVRTRDELVAGGWFGPLRPGVEGRIGDVVAAMDGDLAVVHSRRTRPELLALAAFHGSVTWAERAIPWLTVPARA